MTVVAATEKPEARNGTAVPSASALTEPPEPPANGNRASPSTAQPSLPVDPDEKIPTMEPTKDTTTNFSATGAPSIPDVLRGGVLAPGGVLKWAHKVMECNRAGKLTAEFVASADECLLKCESIKACTHVNVEEYPAAEETKKKFLCRTFSSGSQIVDQSWDYVLHDPVMGKKIPNPVSERDDEINCYMRATADEEKAARELFKADPPPVAYYSLDIPIHTVQYLGMAAVGSIVMIGGVVWAARSRRPAAASK